MVVVVFVFVAAVFPFTFGFAFTVALAFALALALMFLLSTASTAMFVLISILAMRHLLHLLHIRQLIFRKTGCLWRRERHRNTARVRPDTQSSWLIRVLRVGWLRDHRDANISRAGGQRELIEERILAPDGAVAVIDGNFPGIGFRYPGYGRVPVPVARAVSGLSAELVNGLLPG